MATTLEVAHAPSAALGRLQTTALYIGAVLGSGVLLLPGLAAELAGPASLLAWLGMVIVMLPQALTMAFLASRFPSGGGVSTFAREAFGERAGAVTGWLFLLAIPVGGPIAALVGADYAVAALGLPSPWRFGLAALILGGVLISNAFGVQIASRLQVVVVGGIAFSLLLAILGAVPHLSMARFHPFMPHGPWGVGQAAALLYWAFVGWEAVTHFSAEVRDVRRTLLTSVIVAIAVVGCLYLGAAIATVGTGAYGPGGRSSSALVLVVGQAFGPGAASLVGLLALLAVVATSNAYTGAAAQLARSLAVSRVAPGWLGVSGKAGQPVVALGAIALGYMLVFAALMAGAPLQVLITLPTSSYIAIYLLGAAAGLKLADTRFAWWMALISFVSSLAVYPFLGPAALYPPLIALVGAGFHAWGRKSEKSFSASS